MSMGSWQGDDYREIPVPEDITECNTIQRRAYLWERINEQGHPSLLNKTDEAERLDVSRRMVYYDLEAIREFVEATIGERHLGDNASVFEKAKRECLDEGDWKGAVEIVREEAEWLEDRGVIDKEEDQVEVTWREYIESGHDE